MRGKVALLNLEIPWFSEFEAKYRDRGFAFLGVAMDDDGWTSVLSYLEKMKMSYRVMIGDDTLAGGVTATVTQGGQATVTTNSSLNFGGGVVLYAAKLSGRLLGVPITLTPGNVITALLKLLNSLTPLVPVTMTSVTTDDFLVASDSLQANDLSITSG